MPPLPSVKARCVNLPAYRPFTRPLLDGHARRPGAFAQMSIDKLAALAKVEIHFRNDLPGPAVNRPRCFTTLNEPYFALCLRHGGSELPMNAGQRDGTLKGVAFQKFLRSVRRFVCQRSQRRTVVKQLTRALLVFGSCLPPGNDLSTGICY